MITLHSHGFRSFSIRLNESEVEYIVQYNNQELPYRIWKKNYLIPEGVLDHVIAQVNAKHTVRTLIEKWVKKIGDVQVTDLTTTAIFIYGGA